ncbi:MAG: thiamine ABC transporter substrate binding subunit [Granulosicoccus sp.]
MTLFRNLASSPHIQATRLSSSCAALALAFIAATTTPDVHAQDRNLTVYTYESFTAEWGPGPSIKEGFEKQCGDCTVEFVALDSSAGILNRVQLEGANTRADVVLGLDTNLMAIAADTGLLAPSGVDTSALQLPIDWASDTFVPFDYGYFAFVYDTEAVESPPESFDALINAPDDIKIIIQDPRTSTPGLGLLLWMKAVYGDQAAEKWEALQPRIVTVTKGWSEAYFSLFLNGEAPMVLSYSTSPGYHMEIDNTDRYQAAAFDEGHYLQVEVAALLESSPRKELGTQFLKFLVSKDAQRAIPLGNVMYPVIDIEDSMPASFSRLIEPANTLLIPAAEIRDNRKQWINEWLESSSAR